MALDVAKHVAYWSAGANEAMETAELLIGNGRYGFALFFLHLSLEKLLKAIVAKAGGEVPPKTHNLLFLAERTGLKPQPEIMQVLGEFRAYCIIGRYPDSEPAVIDRVLAERELARAREAYTWLQQQCSR
jgi:HEPN domain-containing protein